MLFSTVHDPCKNGNHDCSINAKCIVQPQGTYICECNPFTIDASFDANYPGRRCMCKYWFSLTMIMIVITNWFKLVN